jgi:3-(3-hydroxy-phenyl)propionate hydroxylase
MVAFATRIGAMYQPRSGLTEAVRDALFRGAQRVPGARDYILQMKYKPLPRYVHGVLVRTAATDSGSPVGRMFPQPTLEAGDGTRVKLDDAIGTGFALIVVDDDPLVLLSPRNLEYWQSVGTTFVRIASSRPGQRATGPAGRGAADDDTLVLHDVLGGFRDLVLARPKERAFILRPDRYVAAAGSVRDLDRLSAQLRPLLGIPAAPESSLV